MVKFSKKKRNNNILNNNYKNVSWFIPLIIIITIVPLLIHGKIIELSTEEANFFVGGTMHVDVFSYYKSVALILCTIFSLASYGGLYLNNKLPLQKERRYYIPIMVYILMAILSTIFSYNKHVALVGFIGIYQGLFVLISYMLLTFILINFIRNENDIRIIVYAFVFLIIIEGLLGISQYFNFDFLKTPLGTWLITPNELKGTEIDFTFGKYTIYGTLYNTNFVGSFGALILPISTLLFLFEKEKKKTILFGIVTLLAFSTWLGCNSRAGYLGVLFSTLVGIVIYRKTVKEKFYKTIFILIGFAIITLIFNIASSGRVFNQFKRINPVNEVNNIEKSQQEIKFDEISISDNSFIIRTNRETLIGEMNDSGLIFKDEFDKKLAFSIDHNRVIKFVDEKYSEYTFELPGKGSAVIKANLYGRILKLYVMPDQTIKVISLNKKLTEPVNAAYLKLFEGKETFASNRGYIWSRSIPMLKDTLIVGYGPDNFVFKFPHEDYVGKFNVSSTGMKVLVDKPHNMYLQIAINTGMISLLSLVVIWAIYIIDSLRLYSHGNIITFSDYIGSATFLSILAYLIAGLFNDNVISVAPLFWILLGLGIGINRMVNINRVN